MGRAATTEEAIAFLKRYTKHAPTIKAISPYFTPKYETPGSACFDIAIADSFTLQPRELYNFPTGLHVELPKGYCLLVFARSSLGQRKCIIPNSVGVIDSDYRGEIFIPIMNLSDEPVHFQEGRRYAQGMIVRAEQAGIELVDALSETQRGSGGFGSTGE